MAIVKTTYDRNGKPWTISYPDPIDPAAVGQFQVQRAFYFQGEGDTCSRVVDAGTILTIRLGWLPLREIISSGKVKAK